MSITQERKAELIKEFGKNDKDLAQRCTGSYFVRAIRNLTEHLKYIKRSPDRAAVC